MAEVEYRIISSDSHVIEPHDLWANRVEAEYQDRVPRLVHEPETDRLQFADAELPPVGLYAGCMRKDEEVRWEGRWEEDVPLSGYDPDHRLGDIERDGIDGEVLFPTIAMAMYPIEDIDFQWALFRAYNSWLAEEMCAPHPQRFKGIAMLNHEDPDRAVAELERAKELGLAGVMVPLYSGEDNPYHDERFDPLWAAASAAGLPVNLHSATTRERSKSWNKGTSTDLVLKTSQVQRVLLDLIRAGTFDRFPDLTFVSAENDAGWAGHLLERADFWFKRGRGMRSDWSCKDEPSTYFRRNVRLTFMRDHTAVQSRNVFGVESLMWGNDFPHHVSTWPNSQAILDEHFVGIPDDDRNAIVRDNVQQLYGFA